MYGLGQLIPGGHHLAPFMQGSLAQGKPSSEEGSWHQARYLCHRGAVGGHHGAQDPSAEAGVSDGPGQVPRCEDNVPRNSLVLVPACSGQQGQSPSAPRNQPQEWHGHHGNQGRRRPSRLSLTGANVLQGMGRCGDLRRGGLSPSLLVTSGHTRFDTSQGAGTCKRPRD